MSESVVCKYCGSQIYYVLNKVIGVEGYGSLKCPDCGAGIIIDDEGLIEPAVLVQPIAVTDKAARKPTTVEDTSTQSILHNDQKEQILRAVYASIHDVSIICVVSGGIFGGAYKVRFVTKRGSLILIDATPIPEINPRGARRRLFVEVKNKAGITTVINECYTSPEVHYLYSEVHGIGLDTAAKSIYELLYHRVVREVRRREEVASQRRLQEVKKITDLI